MIASVLLLALQVNPVDRALNYLVGEVAKWRPANGCFSCHNNGDGARALAAAGRIDAPTLEWLRTPALWDSNRSDPAVSDKKLARIQFGNALLAVDPANREAICVASGLIVRDQSAEGSFPVDEGSPVTYGTPLATYFASRVLRACGSHAAEAEKSERFVRAVRPANVADAAARLLLDPADAVVRQYLLAAQTSDGGWGQYPKTPAEPFDTALAMLALRKGPEVERGRAALLRMQEENGGWPPTTRPPGAQSYAQHVSTTAWAVLALLGPK
ncbi:MAG: terpene cyclase/mutase family protein [Acidobacteria bacterium]|nr:terpene cyclase/mutase family protein [Acidobacteriota bacterium]